MGHYDEPDYVYEERAALLEKFNKARNKILAKPMSAYTVGEFIEILNVLRPIYSMHTLNDKDVSVLKRLGTK